VISLILASKGKFRWKIEKLETDRSCLSPFVASKPHTMTKEWQAANIEYMKFQKMNPIFGISSKP
jgi:hypothetical protein